MSDNILRIIPTNPNFVPQAVEQDRARSLLVSVFPNAEDIGIRLTDEVRFVDPGGNLMTIACPVCGSELSTAWWQMAMDQAAQKNFETLHVKTPCCGEVVSLNDLRYDWPAGFARFSLEVESPGASIDEETIRRLSKVLGCEVKVIWAHY